jgi:LysM repeat protein
MLGKSARFLAPIALIAVAVGVYLIVHSTIVKPTVTARPSSTTVVSTPRSPRHPRHEPTFYVVKPGDTLSAIASKTGVPLTTLTTLTPSVSTPPYSLQSGQRLRLKR